MDDPGAGRDFVLKLGHGLHTYGYPAHRIEDTLTRVSRRLGLEGQFFSMPTALFASFGRGGQQQTFQVRVDPGDVHLGKQADVAAVADAVATGALGAEDGLARLEAIEAAPSPYGPALTTLAFALTSGAVSRFFGGGWREAALATVLGLGTGLLALGAGRFATVRRVFEPLAAAVAAALATAAAMKVGPVSVYIATVAGLIVLIPGFSLTVAMIELATRNLMAGTARLVGAASTFLAIAFGVALGTQLARLAVGTPRVVIPEGLPPWTEWAALVIAPLGLTVLLRARPQDAVWIGTAGVLAYAGSRLGAAVLGAELGAFVGALVVGLASNAYARALRRPEVVPLVPGMLLLVPGSLGFQSLSSLLQRDTVLGVEAAFRMTLVAVALSTGLLFANVLLPARAEEARR